MTAAQFLADFQNLLQCDEAVSMDTPLQSLEEWDSLAVMACIAYLDTKCGVKTSFATYKGLQSVADIAALAKGSVA
jgi:acyl carrier protein